MHIFTLSFFAGNGIVVLKFPLAPAMPLPTIPLSFLQCLEAMVLYDV